jgi:cell division protein FtsQ
MTKLKKMPIDIKFVNTLAYLLFGIFISLSVFIGFQYAVNNNIKNINMVTIKGDVNHNNFSSINGYISNNIFGNLYSVNLKKTKQIFESAPWISHAVVKRVYPNEVEVTLREYKSKAIWGAREDMKLVDDTGKIFEVGADDDEYESLPQLIGPEGQSKLMLDMYKDVSNALQPLRATVQNLELNARGSWIATLDGGTHIELGRGNAIDVIDRVDKFSLSIEKMLKKLNKKSLDIQYVDLRHSDGYALRMHGVSTLDATLASTSFKK